VFFIIGIFFKTFLHFFPTLVFNGFFIGNLNRHKKISNKKTLKNSGWKKMQKIVLKKLPIKKPLKTQVGKKCKKSS